MTEKEIIKWITSKRVQLKGWEQLNHYLLSTLFFVGIIVEFGKIFVSNAEIRVQTIFLYLVAGTFFFLLQRRALRFTVIETQKPRKEILSAIKKTGEELNWNIYTIQQHLIVANTSPKWTSGSWGERITIILYQDNVYINSMCAPDEKSSIYANGRNKRNVKTLVKNIER